MYEIIKYEMNERDRESTSGSVSVDTPHVFHSPW